MSDAIDLLSVRTAKVVFHGRLKAHGAVTARASTPARLLAAAMRLRPGLQADLLDGHYNLYRGDIIAGREMELIGLHLTLPPDGTLHVIPAGGGAKNGQGIGKAILGAVVVAGALAAAPWSGGTSVAATLGTSAFSVAGFGFSYGSIALFGATLFLSGISSLISPQSSTTSTSDASTTLGGTPNNVNQGSCVPLIYGKQVRVGSTVISAGYSAEDYNATVSAFADAVTTTSATASSGTGSKGLSKSSSSSGSTEAANTLRSKAVVRIIDLLGEGPGVNLVDGAKSIYFNGTPLMASDGTYNFEGVSFLTRSGDPDQEPVTGYPSAENTHTISTQVKQATPVTTTITSATATAARVTIRLPALFTTNTSNGNIEVGPDLGLTIQVRPTGGSFATVVTDLFHGQKCTSAYQKSYRFDLPGVTSSYTPGSWDIRVTRTTPDSTVTTTSSDLYFDYCDDITDHLLIYPNSAYVAFTIDSSAFGDSVPTRTYDVTGKSVMVPSNYDPVGHTYASSGTGTSQGTWDGVSWKLAQAVDDPCWIMYDMVQSTRYGFGLSSAATAALAYDFYPISQYCAQPVDDGLFGTEPRYTMNVGITSAGDAYKALQQFAGVFRGMTYWTAGGVAITADMPTAPTMLVTNANVIGGKFTYEGSAGSTRHNAAIVSYIDANNSYQSSYETYIDQYSVSSVGYRPVSVDAFGCTSRGLARRLGRWMIDTELHQTQTVTYDCSIDHAGVRPGDIVAIADKNYQGARLGGRCRGGGNPHLIAIDQHFTPDPTLTYTIQITNSDGSIYSSAVTAWNNASDASGDYCIATVSTSVGTVQPNAIFIITATPTYNTPQWQVLSNTEKSAGIYTITAVYFDPGKFDRVEKRLPFNAISYSSLPSLLATPIPPPSNVTAIDYTVGVGTTTVIRVNIGWSPATDARITGYGGRAINQSTGETTYYDMGTGTTYNIDGLPAAEYTFSVRSNGANGMSSVWVDSSPVDVDGSEDAPAAPTGMTAVGGTRRITTSWIAPALRNLLHYELQRAPDSNGQPGSFTTLTYVDATSYTDTDENNLEPLTTWWYRVRAISTMGSLGDFSGNASAETTELLVDDLPTAIQNTAKYAQGLLNSIGQPHDYATLADAGTQPDGAVVFNEADGKLYKEVNGSLQPLVPLIGDQNGQLTSDQIASVAAASVVGQLTAAQIASINAAQIAGQLVAAQIASVSASIITGQLTSAQIAGLDAAKLTSQITSTQITDGAISTPKIAAGAVVAASIAAGAVTASALSVGSSGNVLPNSTFSYDTSAWGVGAGSAVTGTPSFSALFQLSQTGPKQGAACLSTVFSGNSGGWQDVYAMTAIDCVAGDTIEAQALVLGYACNAFVYIAFTDATGKDISYAGADVSKPGSGIVPAATSALPPADINSYARTWVIGTAPAKTASARLTIRQQQSGATSGAVPLYIASVLLGKTVANATQPSSWSPGGLTTISGGQISAATITGLQVAANTITGNNIVAGTITTTQLAAGSVTASQLTVASSTNQIWNPSCYDSMDGWLQLFDEGNGTVLSPGGSFVSGAGKTVAPSGSYLVSEGSSWMQWAAGSSSKVGTNQKFILAWVDDGKGIPIQSGATVEASAYIVAGNDCYVTILLQFVDGAGNTTAAYSSDTVVPCNLPGFATNTSGAPTAGTLDYFTRIGLVVTAPFPASYVIMQVQGRGTSAGAVQPYFAATRMSCGIVPSGTTQIGQYAPGGVTSISGAMIKTGTLNASKIIAGTITAGQIAASTITGTNIAAATITGNNIAANTITANNMTANSIAAGMIQAGAISSDQIAANQIYGYHLAAAQIISLQAQIGNLVVNTIHVIDNAITTFATVNYTSTLTGNSAFQEGGSITINAQGAQTGLCVITWEQGFTTYVNSQVGFAISVNGNSLKSRTGEANVSDYPAYSFPVTLNNGSNTIDFQWWGNSQVSCTSRTITIFTRLK